MAPLHRILVGVSLILLVCGAAGAWHGMPGNRSRSSGLPGPATTSPAPTTSSTSPSPTTAAPPGPSSSALASGLVTPTDMGGYYRTVPGFGDALIASSPCLALIGRAGAQSGRALTGLLGPDEHSVPSIVEEVASYPGASARSHFDAAVAAIGACATLSFDFGGPTVTARLAPVAVPPIGDADQVWSGSFTAEGASFSIELGTVLVSDEVLALVWIDSVPPSDAVMGSFVSTLSLAIGKLA